MAAPTERFVDVDDEGDYLQLPAFRRGVAQRDREGELARAIEPFEGKLDLRLIVILQPEKERRPQRGSSPGNPTPSSAYSPKHEGGVRRLIDVGCIVDVELEDVADNLEGYAMDVRDGF